MIVQFPPVELADDESGLLAVGGDLEIASLELAYRNGIFPWPVSEHDPILWFAPPERAILEFDKLRIPRRLKRELKKVRFELRINTCFAEVIKACARSTNRRGQPGTWLTADMIDAFIRFHEVGMAHSFETFDEHGKLVGGMYGVKIGRYFAGESMFYIKTNASKFALLQAVSHLKQRGSTWMDVQVMTPLLASFGAIDIPRDLFMQRLKKATFDATRDPHDIWKPN